LEVSLSFESNVAKTNNLCINNRQLNSG